MSRGRPPKPARHSRRSILARSARTLTRGGRRVTVTVNLMPLAAWSATVQKNVYRPRPSRVRISLSPSGRTMPVSARPTPLGPRMRRSWSSSPMFLSCRRSTPAGSVRRLGEKRNSSANTSIRAGGGGARGLDGEGQHGRL